VLNELKSMSMTAVALLTLSTLLAGCSSTPDPDRGLESLFEWDSLPAFRSSRYRQISSYDRGRKTDYPIVDPGNKDFNNFVAVCGTRPETLLQEVDDHPSRCDPGNEGYLIAADDSGPGFVSRIWFTAAMPVGDPSLEDEVLRIYVDGATTPTHVARLADWRAGGTPLFSKPLTGWWSGSMASYLPISYQSKLRITLDKLDRLKLYYYHVNLRTSEPTKSFDPGSFDLKRLDQVRAALTGKARAVDDPAVLADRQVSLPPPKEVLVLDHKGSGTIRLFELVFDAVTADELRGVALQIGWDEEPSPAIDVPLATLFGADQAIASFDTLPMRVKREAERVTLSLYLPMPFSRRAVLRLKNTGTATLSPRVRVECSTRLPAGDWGHLHARYHRETAPLAPDARFPVVSLKGRGRYVGTMMSLEGQANHDGLVPLALNFLEGDETGTIDGEVTVRGTGTEDYFNGGFYFKDGSYSSPFSALIHIEQDDAALTGAATLVRWHVLSDAIDFSQSFSLDFEYGADKPQTAFDYRSVALFYLW